LYKHQIISRQETWVATGQQHLDKLMDISGDHFTRGTAEMSYQHGVTTGRPRPYSGTRVA